MLLVQALGRVSHAPVFCGADRSRRPTSCQREGAAVLLMAWLVDQWQRHAVAVATCCRVLVLVQ